MESYRRFRANPGDLRDSDDVREMGRHMWEIEGNEAKIKNLSADEASQLRKKIGEQTADLLKHYASKVSGTRPVRRWV